MVSRGLERSSLGRAAKYPTARSAGYAPLGGLSPSKYKIVSTIRRTGRGSSKSSRRDHQICDISLVPHAVIPPSLLRTDAFYLSNTHKTTAMSPKSELTSSL